MNFKELYETFNDLDKQEISLIGRVRSNRQGKKVSFLIINDGTTFEDTQVVYKEDLKNYEEINGARVSAIVEVKGIVVLTPNKKQQFEIEANKIIILDQAVEDYPLQKKEHSLEFLREIAHLRARTKTFNAIFKIRSELAFAIHKFFNKKGFVYVNTPIITENDAEGAGESFIVTTVTNGDYQKDFFEKKACLTVSGQLNGEAYAQAFKSIYTFGPTFRAENSNTTKHAAEFWMIEPELAFGDLYDDINLIGNMIKFLINYVFEKCQKELEFCDKNLEPGLIEKLKKVMHSDPIVMDYKEAIKVLQDAVKNGHDFEIKDIEFGLDLSTEHERYICEVYNKAPTFVTNYPKEIKAFYMKQNDDGKTVAAVDLLVPGIGELVGGSQREENYDKLISRCNELNINIKDLKWYLDLRKYGYYRSCGFGLGFERLVMYVTGASNIRDAIPFPRTPKNLLF